MEILFAQLIVSPAATEQRQIDVALSLIVERQTRYQQLPSFNVFCMTRPGFEPRPPGFEADALLTEPTECKENVQRDHLTSVSSPIH